MSQNYISVTEISDDKVTREQLDRLCCRYYWAGSYCKYKDVIEVACGAGQGLGYIASIANSIEAGDISKPLLDIVRKHYGDRIALKQFDAQKMPFEDSSKDIIILFEAIYYLTDAEEFVKECARMLRPGGKVLIATANKDLYDFNPSPYSYRYYGIVELQELFQKCGFTADFFGDTPIDEVSLLQKVLRPIKKLVVVSGLMPKSMAGKKLLKKIVFGKLVKMPAEISADTSQCDKPNPVPAGKPDKKHKVIYCVATLNPKIM